MTKPTLFIASFLLALAAHAQTANTSGAQKPAVPARVEPKTTKKEAKVQCREEGRTGKALIDCIKEKSGS